MIAHVTSKAFIGSRQDIEQQPFLVHVDRGEMRIAGLYRAQIRYEIGGLDGLHRGEPVGTLRKLLRHRRRFLEGPPAQRLHEIRTERQYSNLQPEKIHHCRECTRCRS